MQRSVVLLVMAGSFTGCLFGPKHEAPSSGAVTGKPVAVVQEKKIGYPVQRVDQVSDEEIFRIVVDTEARSAKRPRKASARTKHRVVAERFNQDLQKMTGS